MTDKVFVAKNGILINNAVTANSTIINLANATLQINGVTIGNGQLIAGNTSGGLQFTTPAGVTASGSNTQVQYNSSGSFGASAGLTFDSVGNNLTVGNTLFVPQVSIGNSTVNVIANGTTIFVGNTSTNVTVNTSTIYLGNTTVNSYINSTALNIANSTSQTLLTATTRTTGNSTVNSSVNSTAVAIQNSSANLILTSSSLKTGQVSITNTSILTANINCNTISTNSYTLQANDSSTLIIFSNTQNNTLTVPNGLPQGFRCMALRAGGSITASNASQVLLFSRSGGFAVLNQYGSMSLLCFATNATSQSFVIDGNI